MSAKLLREATEVAVRSYADGARTHKSEEPRRRQWLRIRDALRAVVDAGLLVVPTGENEAYNAGYQDGLGDGGSCSNGARDVPAGNIRPEAWVHDEYVSGDPVRTFYEIPDGLAQVIRTAACVDGEGFAGCLHNLILEREGALAEVKRLTRALKEGRSGR